LEPSSKTDPVCGKPVNVLRARAVAIVGGQTFYFCSTEHKAEFARDPARFGAVPTPYPVNVDASSLPQNGGGRGAPSDGNGNGSFHDLPTAPLEGVRSKIPPTPKITASQKLRVASSPSLPRIPSTPRIRAAAPQTLHFNVRGMSCASCVGRVEKAIAQVPGVAQVSVNLAFETAQVTITEATTTAADIEAAVRGAGYEAFLHGSGATTASATPETTLGGERDRRVRDVRVRAQLAAGGAALVMALAMLLPHSVVGGWVQLVLTVAVVFGTGARFYRNAASQARHAATNMDTLIALGATAALALSVRGLLARGHNLAFETASAIVAFALVGRWLEERAKQRTGDAILGLMRLRPEVAHRLLPDGSTRDVPVAQIKVGDLLRVLPGDRIPADGIVREGTSTVDESLLTGEATPVDKAAGARVHAGTCNIDGSFDFQAARVGADTTLAKIVRLVEGAQGSRVPLARLADRVSAVFVPAVLGLAALVFGIFLLRGAGVAGAAVPAVAVLVVACPCALGLATPTAILVGTGTAARRGILIRAAETLERAESLKVVILDKTGTVTEGRPQVTSFVPAAGADPLTVLPIVAGCEALSEHPLAKTLRAYAEACGVAPRTPSRFRAVAGHGIVAEVDGQAVVVGNRRLLDTESIPIPADPDDAGGKTPVYVAIAGQVQGTFWVGDRIKEGAQAALKALADRNIEVFMVTGDVKPAAEAVAAQVGLDAAHVRSEVRPEGKAQVVAELKQNRGAVAMVGDGINDAPALAAADVGIAMGTGSDVALSAAHVTLQRGDLRGLVEFLQLSERTVRVIRQNLAFAFAYNLVALLVAGSGLLGRHAPMIAAAAIALSSFTVVSNSLRLGSRKT
jgi:Cu+-exporting ATPase